MARENVVFLQFHSLY